MTAPAYLDLAYLDHNATSPLRPVALVAMEEALGEGGQVILLLNRRGFSTHVHCPACGYVSACPNCDLSLTFHATVTP